MPWLQIKVSIPPEQAEAYEDLLLAAGCAAVTYQDAADQPIFEPDLGTTPLWSDTVVTGLFAAEHDLRETLQLLQAAQQQIATGQTALPEFKAEILEDKDWEREWMDSYHPMRFGNRLWVCPSWREAPEPDAVNLMLDPGLAFGTGTHPTTALCLEWLDGQTLTEQQVVDYGCGSGILGIAALLLGARHVQAVDIDPQALTATRDNLQRNQLPDAALDTYLPLQAPILEADLLVANILAGPLCELAPTLAARVRPGGKILLSGLLSQQADEIRSTYSQWFKMDEPGEREGWIRISGTRLQES
ncbi:MAG: 50S ribosomal protein L11 methyltransferase [Oceanospirillales bacterium]|uniref:Ribosomal protein L11 methyltransferase n=1 Tax=Marinobacterium halophilum TaxID=267374 RepID=A0A2P8F1D2_9GAMM|nr:50S ribosomal protein L11 methyltransferase [Marinobacterium halophilum]MBR9829122.1 50S ribosomal protein L11 methyltransferase [Oceanospirillales bacterium]PSL15522.1 [LSU ribosomal protein L11P]-lysine N-methyltransferase [Marinobacterium halophilum]